MNSAREQEVLRKSSRGACSLVWSDACDPRRQMPPARRLDSLHISPLPSSFLPRRFARVATPQAGREEREGAGALVFRMPTCLVVVDRGSRASSLG